MSCRFNLLIDVEGTVLTLRTPKSGGKPAVIRQGATVAEFEATTDAAVDAWFDGAPVPSCLIDEIEAKGEHTLGDVADVLCVTTERARQIEIIAKERLAKQKRKQFE